MMSIDTLREMIASLPEVTEAPHAGKISFRVNKKIFATYDEQLQIACVKLSKIDQSVFCSGEQKVVYPVANKWGKQGWTLIDLEKVNKDLLIDALLTAYCEVAPKKLSMLIRTELDC